MKASFIIIITCNYWTTDYPDYFYSIFPMRVLIPLVNPANSAKQWAINKDHNQYMEGEWEGIKCQMLTLLM